MELREGRFRLLQDGMIVAQSVGPRDAALREIVHYAHVYSQEGSVLIEERKNGGKWKQHVP